MKRRNRFQRAAILSFRNPRIDGEYVQPADYKLTYNLSESSHKSYTKGIEATYNLTDTGILIEVTNRSGRALDTIGLKCLLYDPNGSLIGVEEKYAHCKEPNSTDYLRIAYPRDADRKEIIPARCVIYVGDVYRYR